METNASSTFDGTALGASEEVELVYNNSKSSKSYTVSGTGVRDIDGTSVSSFNLGVFESILLIGENINVTED